MLLQSITEQDLQNDGIFEDRYEENNVYDENGNLIHSDNNTDVDGDRVIDQSNTADYLFDDKGLVVYENFKSYIGNQEELDSLGIINYLYDEDGKPLKIERNTDLQGDSDNIFDFRIVTDNQYNRSGNLISEVTVSHNLNEMMTDTWIKSYHYDTNQLVRTELLFDGGTDGEIDYSIKESFLYNDNGTKIQEVEENDSNFDGDSDILRLRLFDEHERLTWEVYIADFDDDGSTDQEEVTSYSYLDQESIFPSLTEINIDDDGNGLVETRIIETEIMSQDRLTNTSTSDYFIATRPVKLGFPNDPAIYEIRGTRANDILRGTGLGDKMLGRAGDDRLSGLDGADLLLGNQGQDSLYGGIGTDTLKGGANDDVLVGGEGKDILVGGSGNDRLNGGSGLDTLRGGAGNDNFVIHNSRNKADRITDFDPVDDSILIRLGGFDLDLDKGRLEHKHFSIGSAAADRSDRFIYNDQTGALLFDSDGSRNGPAVAIASLDPGLALSAAHIRII